MDDYRTNYATPGQIDSVWSVIYALRRQVEELTERLSQMEAGGAVESVALAAEAAKPAIEVQQS